MDNTHLIVVDYYSFTVFERPLTSLNTTSVVAAFKTIFSDTGIPLVLVTDNALCFTSEEFEDFVKSLELYSYYFITKIPQRQRGHIAEKAVGMVKQTLQTDVTFHCMEYADISRWCHY